MKYVSQSFNYLNVTLFRNFNKIIFNILIKKHNILTFTNKTVILISIYISPCEILITYLQNAASFKKVQVT